jgi:hypothetical protein
MNRTGMLVAGVFLSAAALAATPSVVAAAPAGPALAAAASSASITVSPGSAKVGSTVELRATCSGKITDQPTSPALTGITKIANVPAPQAAWRAKVKAVKTGSWTVVYSCDGVITSTEFKVTAAKTTTATKSKQVARKPVGAAKTGAGGTAGW